jgi:hypothetical protein
MVELFYCHLKGLAGPLRQLSGRHISSKICRDSRLP